MSECLHFLSNFRPLFNIGKWMAKTLQIRLNYIRNSYNLLLYKVALTDVYNKIIYNCGEINLTKENLGKER